jgi:hypothetical protein
MAGPTRAMADSNAMHGSSSSGTATRSTPRAGAPSRRRGRRAARALSAAGACLLLLSLSLPAAAILLVVGQALTPNGLDHPITKLSTAIRELPIAAAHSERLYVANLFVIFGLGALGLSFAAIATLVRGRGAVLATAAAAVGGLALFCGALVNTFVGYDLAAAARAHTSQARAEQVLLAANRGWGFDLLLAVYLGGVVIATLAIAVALWRARTVPRWLPVLFVIGIALGAPAPAGLVSIPLQLPIAVALVVLAVRIWRAADRGQVEPVLVSAGRSGSPEATSLRPSRS